VNTNTPCSLRLPHSLRQRIRVRAERERRSFANEVRVLLERQLDAPWHDEEVDPIEIERLAELCCRTIEEAERS
jgi:plasmid stability protein